MLYTCLLDRKHKNMHILNTGRQQNLKRPNQVFHKWQICIIILYMTPYAYQSAHPPAVLCVHVRAVFPCWHAALRVTPVRLLHVRAQTAPSITRSPKINGACKLCSKTVTAQFKVWPSESGGLRWKDYFMPCTKANATVQRDLPLIF